MNPFTRERIPKSCPPCHWIISPPDSSTSLGVCKNCGDIKEFKNSIPVPAWELDRGGPEVVRARQAYLKGLKEVPSLFI